MSCSNQTKRYRTQNMNEDFVYNDHSHSNLENNDQQAQKNDCFNSYCQNVTSSFTPKKAVFNSEEIFFCQKCFEFYRQNQYCYFCAQVYEQDECYDGKQWIKCDNHRCNRWNHIDCELKKGQKDIETNLNNKNFKYYCPNCRNKRTVQQDKKKTTKVAARRQQMEEEPSEEDRFPFKPKKNDTIEDMEMEEEINKLTRRNIAAQKTVGQGNITQGGQQNYQTIEILMKKYGGQLQLNSYEIEEDLAKINSKHIK